MDPDLGGPVFGPVVVVGQLVALTVGIDAVAFRARGDLADEKSFAFLDRGFQFFLVLLGFCSHQGERGTWKVFDCIGRLDPSVGDFSECIRGVRELPFEYGFLREGIVEPFAFPFGGRKLNEPPFEFTAQAQEDHIIDEGMDLLIAQFVEQGHLGAGQSVSQDFFDVLFDGTCGAWGGLELEDTHAEIPRVRVLAGRIDPTSLSRASVARSALLNVDSRFFRSSHGDLEIRFGDQIGVVVFFQKAREFWVLHRTEPFDQEILAILDCRFEFPVLLAQPDLGGFGEQVVRLVVSSNGCLVTASCLGYQEGPCSEHKDCNVGSEGGFPDRIHEFVAVHTRQRDRENLSWSRLGSYPTSYWSSRIAIFRQRTSKGPWSAPILWTWSPMNPESWDCASVMSSINLPLIQVWIRLPLARMWYWFQSSFFRTEWIGWVGEIQLRPVASP